MADPTLKTAIITACAAAIGYVGKAIWEMAAAWFDRRAARKAGLVKLQSLLLASRNAFRAQAKIRNSLCDELKAANPALQGRPYDDVLADAYPAMSDAQRLRHQLLRAFTIHALTPLNQQMLEWLAHDTFYKQADSELGLALRQAEVHLVLWNAKCKLWIERPERALVYLDDEWGHGVGFPHKLDELVLAETGTRLLSDE